MEIQVLASGSAGNCYRVSDGVTPLLIECGIPWKRIMQGCNFETWRIAACLISHEHQDHAKSVKMVMKAGIDVWASFCTLADLNILGHRCHPVCNSLVDERNWFPVGTWRIFPFHVEHDAAEPIGFLLDSEASGERLMYATDTAYIRNRFSGLTHIMVECNYSLDLLRESVTSGDVPRGVKRRIMESHFSIDNVIQMLKSNDLSKLQAIYLLHLSSNNSDREEFKKRVQEATGVPVYV